MAHVKMFLNGLTNSKGEVITTNEDVAGGKQNTAHRSHFSKNLLNVSAEILDPLNFQYLVFYVHPGGWEKPWEAHDPDIAGDIRRFSLDEVITRIHRLKVPEGWYLGSKPLHSAPSDKNVRVVCSPHFDAKVHYVVISDQDDVATVQQQYPDGTVILHMFQILWFDRLSATVGHPNEILNQVRHGHGNAKRLSAKVDPLKWIVVQQTGSSELFFPMRMTRWQNECIKNYWDDPSNVRTYKESLAKSLLDYNTKFSQK
jgi:hypothetical protein